MLRASGGQLVSQLLRTGAFPSSSAASTSGSAAAATCIASLNSQQLRFIGGDKVPEFWGKPSAYTEGTDFLGTPQNHLKLINQRPLSPDVIEIDNKRLHYKLPWSAISSIANRATGTVLSIGFGGAAYIALTGDLPGLITSIAASSPLLLFPAKFFLSYNLIYHYGGGVRHLIWDKHKIGNMAEKNSLLELPAVVQSSKALLYGSAVLAFIVALL